MAPRASAASLPPSAGRDGKQLGPRRVRPSDDAIDARKRLFMFTVLANNPNGWLFSGCSLMRASLAVQRQLALDAKTTETARRARGLVRRPIRARLHMPAVFMAALAVENALKGAIVARTSRFPEDGKLRPTVLGMATGHDLVHLARHARVSAKSLSEERALASGRLYIEAFGRYPVALDVDRHPANDVVTDPSVLCPAYQVLFLTAVDVAARAMWRRNESFQTMSKRSYAAQEVALHRSYIAGVYGSAIGEEGLDLF